MKICRGILIAGLSCLSHCAGLSAKDYDTVEMSAPHLGGMTVGFNVIFPREYASATRRYPVLYLLHGYTDHYPAWVSFTDLTQYARGYQQIIVMPEGDNGYYTNSASDPQLAWEDFIIRDLIPYIDSHYRTIDSRQGRAIAGLSMGGYGAFKLALKYPHLFSAAASLSGALGAPRWQERFPVEDPEYQKLILGIFGPRGAPGRSENDPFELIKKVPPDQRPQLYLSVGTSDNLLEDSREFVRLLAEFKVPYEYHEFPGEHDWPVWDREIQVVLALQTPVIGAR